ncbi:MAG TPA: MBL fold metallo-hydrolase [Candidatus Dormibacteraeota bacterium]|nr:MBL fold metallo-hydrolase [Candidatus Dormibacteraeota bacterium]
MHPTTNCLSLLCCLLLSLSSFGSTPANSRATILYDAFGNSKNLEKDWGFSVLIEYSGKKILFDTGNNSKIFADNVKTMGVDLKDLDFVVISHRHGDHTSGLNYLLKVNPKVKIYVPAELFGAFGSTLPKGFYKTVDTLPASMRYFDGEEPPVLSSGSPWPEGNFVLVESTLEVAPGMSLIPTISTVKGTLELRELTLAIDTPLGRVLVVGCSHPGVEEILSAASPANSHVHMLLGGLHLVKTPDSEIDRLANALHDKWAIDRIAPGHCTGEPAFAKLKQVFGASYIYAGLGSRVEIQ